MLLEQLHGALYHAVKRVLCLIGKVRVVIREVLGVPAVANTLIDGTAGRTETACTGPLRKHRHRLTTHGHLHQGSQSD